LQDFEDDAFVYRKLEGNPIVGTNLTLVLESTCDECILINATFLGSNGNPLDTFSLEYVNRSSEYVADFIVPSEPFFVKVVGWDEHGQMFQRMLPSQVTPSHLQLHFLNPPATVSGMTPGSRDNLTFTITNRGVDGYFQLYVTDNAEFVMTFQPRNFLLKSNEKISGNISVMVPWSASPGTVSNLELSVREAKGGASIYNTNFFRTSFFVAAEVFDDIPPRCTVSNSTFAEICQPHLTDETCHAHYWLAILHLIDQGSGLGTVLSRDNNGGNVTWTTSPTVFDGLKNQNVSAYVTGNCCLQRVQFSVVDQTGLSGTCTLSRLSSGDPTKLSEGAIAAIGIGLLVLLVIFTTFFFRKTKNRRVCPVKNSKKTEIFEVSIT
jgi:hypothetical protein